MNDNLNQAIFDLGKVCALMTSIEAAYVLGAERKGAQAEYAFYALWDEIKLLEKHLDLAATEDAETARQP